MRSFFECVSHLMHAQYFHNFNVDILMFRCEIYVPK